MLDGHLQPLPVERASGLPNANLPSTHREETAEFDPASLELENRHLLSGHQGTVSEGLQHATHMATSQLVPRPTWYSSVQTLSMTCQDSGAATIPQACFALWQPYCQLIKTCLPQT